MGIRKIVFLFSEGSSKVKLSAGTAARPSALLQNPIIPPIIAVTLSWPLLFPAVTHNLGISLIFFTPISLTGSLPNIAPCHLHLIADLDKSEPQFSCHACFPTVPIRTARNKRNNARNARLWMFSWISGDQSGSENDCRFSYGETCWLRPVARPIWAAAGAIWLSNMEKLQHDTVVQYKVKNVLGLVPSIVN